MPPPEESLKSALEKATKYLIDRSCIGRFVNGLTRQAVAIEKDELYASLVSLYTKMIQSNWSHFRPTAENAHPPPTESSSSQPDYAQHMARVYISHWFIDLYVLIKEACEKLSVIDFQQYYENDLPSYSHEYDVFLQHINSGIRPTTIRGTTGELTYFPYFANITPDNGKNPLNIKNAELNPIYLRNIISSMKDSGWKFKELVANKTGRPIWLFDWLDKDTMCSWFPMEPNYTIEDCVYAYVIGTACTPKLAHRDQDDKQIYKNNILPTSPKASDYKRIRPRTKWAAYEYTEFDPNTSFEVAFPNPYYDIMLESSRQKKLKFSQEREVDDELNKTFTVKYNCYQFTDYLYYARVIQKTTEAERCKCLLAILTAESA